MDPYDVAGGAKSVCNVLSEVRKRLTLYLEEGHGEAEGLRCLQERLSGLCDALSQLEALVADSENITSEEVIAQYSKVWTLIDSTVKDCKSIAKRLKQQIRRNSLQSDNDNASLRSIGSFEVLLDERDTDRCIFQVEAHELILKAGLDLLSLVVSSRSASHDDLTLQQQTTNNLRRQLIRIESVRQNVEMEDEDVVDEATRQAMANAHQMKVEAQAVLLKTRSSTSKPMILDRRATIDFSDVLVSSAIMAATGPSPSTANAAVDPGGTSSIHSTASNPGLHDDTESPSHHVAAKAAYSDLEPLLRDQQTSFRNPLSHRERSVPHQYQAYRPYAALPNGTVSEQFQAYELPASFRGQAQRSPSEDLCEVLRSQSYDDAPVSRPIQGSQETRIGQSSPTYESRNFQNTLGSPEANASPAKTTSRPLTSPVHSTPNQGQQSPFGPFRIPTDSFETNSSSLRQGIQLLRDHRYIDDDIKHDLLKVRSFPTNAPYLIRKVTDALRPACRLQDKNAARVILQIGGDPNINSDTEPKLTLLIELVKKRRVELIEILVDGGADVNAQIDDSPFASSSNSLKKSSIHGSLSALSYACLSGYDDVVEALLARHANVDFATGDRGLRPIFLAALAGHASVVEKLLDADSTPLSEKQKYDVVLNVAHVAAWRGKISVMNVLLRSTHAANLFARQSLIFFEGYWGIADKQSWKYDRLPDSGTALHAAVIGKEKPLEATEFILRKGILPVDAPDSKGRTALHLGTRFYRQSHEDIIRKLLEYDANINAADKQGRTPLHMLVRQSPKFEADVPVLLRLVRDFMGRGANPDQPDNDGVTPRQTRMRLYPDSVGPRRRFSMPEDSLHKLNRKYTSELDMIFKRLPTDDMILVTDELDPI